MFRRPLVSSILASAFVSALAAVPAMAQGKPLVTPKDLGKWESLGATRISSDGAWVAWQIARGNDENDARLRGGARDTTIVLQYGTGVTFSPDAKWAGYLIGVAPKERERLTKEKKPVHTSVGLRNLTSGETVVIADASAFAFAPSGGFASISKYAADGKRVNDMIVIDLNKGSRVAFSNVSEQSWNDRKPLLAFTTQADNGAGNGVQVYDGSTGGTRVLEWSPNVYRALAWRSKSDDLAVLRAAVDKAFLDTAHVVLAFSNAASDNVSHRTLDAATLSGFPAGVRVADYRRPTWSRDGATLYLGVRRREPTADAPKKADEKISDVEIWHTNDVHVIPEQRSAEQRDLRSTMLVAWQMAGNRVVSVGTDVAETATVLDGDKLATENDRKPYAFGQKFGRRDEDVYTVDLTTGARTKLLTKIRELFSADPTGTNLPWFDGRDYWIANVATGARINLTATLRAKGADFVDHDDDHPSDVASPIGAPMWSKDGSRLLVNSEFDVWSLALDGTGGKRLTDGARDGVVHRVVSFAGFGASGADRAVDMSKPVYLSLYGKRSKKSGYARLQPNGEVQALVLADASIGGLAKADSSDKVIFVRQSFAESPNVFLADGALANAKKVSDTNPFQKDYAWGKAELTNFTSTIGKPLQAILYYPANYDPSKKYPMIVYTYELLSQGLHRYIVPRENDYYNANVFTQNGYFVLMPDIVFRPREPGLAVLQSVEAAVNKVIARGLVDPANIGHCGHSQGGYEAYFLATHSKLFKTAVAGAGISDMWSFAGQMHWSSVPEFDHWETGQFRMQVAPWEDPVAMQRNNPLDKVHVMPAKSMLIEIGGDDPTVDMRQGVEFYNYARRAGKNAVMLLYPGEGHGLGKKENAVDYERRILQWFGHYLKGEAAPSWITNGQTWLERKALLDANKER